MRNKKFILKNVSCRWLINFGQVKNLIVLLLTLSSSKKYLKKVPCCLQSLQNSLRRNRMLRQPILFDWLPEHPVFFIHPPFLTQLVRPHLATYSSLCSICVTQGMSCHTIGYQLLLTQPPSQGSRRFTQGWQSFQAWASAHIPRLIATNLLSQIFIYIRQDWKSFTYR